MRIRFLKTWRMYQAGEVALFDADLAAKIVAGGFGVAAPADEAEAGAEPEAGAEAEAQPEAEADLQSTAAGGKRQK